MLLYFQSIFTISFLCSTTAIILLDSIFSFVENCSYRCVSAFQSRYRITPLFLLSITAGIATCIIIGQLFVYFTKQFFPFPGVSIKLIVEEYLQTVSNFQFKVEFDPTLLHDTSFNFDNRIFVEHNHLYHWHQMMPEEFNIDG